METGLKPASANHNKKQRHRQMLIDATIDTICEFGIAGASITKIVNRSGLSRGMIHLHFDNKEHLLIEAARHTNEAYFATMNQALKAIGGDPRDRLLAMINADLSQDQLNPKAVSVWFAFRGEARQHNSFARYSNTRDQVLQGMYIEVFQELAAGRNEQEMLARDAAHGTIALLEGMWSDYMLHPNAFNRITAKRITVRFISALFPGCFDFADQDDEKEMSS